MSFPQVWGWNHVVWTTLESTLCDGRTQLVDTLVGHFIIHMLPIWFSKVRIDASNTHSLAGRFGENYLPYKRPESLEAWRAPVSPLTALKITVLDMTHLVQQLRLALWPKRLVDPQTLTNERISLRQTKLTCRSYERSTKPCLHLVKQYATRGTSREPQSLIIRRLKCICFEQMNHGAHSVGLHPSNGQSSHLFAD